MQNYTVIIGMGKNFPKMSMMNFSNINLLICSICLVSVMIVRLACISTSRKERRLVGTQPFAMSKPSFLTMILY